MVRCTGHFFKTWAYADTIVEIRAINKPKYLSITQMQFVTIISVTVVVVFIALLWCLVAARSAMALPVVTESFTNGEEDKNTHSEEKTSAAEEEMPLPALDTPTDEEGMPPPMPEALEGGEVPPMPPLPMPAPQFTLTARQA